ncbi:hypothetical protein [Kocuria sp.]|uniref:hypothetical protein n=1 Tax=Kocuria sp. TaxID=1871328 RepID=UPI0026DF5CE9|nr:hypothetical protein [Kocuria sp.]MDO5618511.1 hypothetical protein [Kocuria sp.]
MPDVPQHSHETERPLTPQTSNFWKRLRYQAVFALVMAVVSVLAVLVGELGVLRSRHGGVIEDGALLGTVLLAAFASLWAWLLFDSDRADHGFPRRGLVALLMLCGPTYAVVSGAAFMVWPVALGENADPSTLTGSLGTYPMGILVLSLACWVLVNLGLTFGVPVFAEVPSVGLKLLLIVPWLAVIVGGVIWMVIWTEANPVQASSAMSVLIMTVLVLLSQLAVLVCGLLIQWARVRRERAWQGTWHG